MVDGQMIFDEKREDSLSFMKQVFQNYYVSNDVEMPDRFSRREYAFILFNSRGMMRHIGFNRKQSFSEFLQIHGPQHVYYSSAYYKYPDASTMQEKGWMGAELIFDLDSDHLPNAKNMGFEESLSIVKKEFIKLVSEFLLKDFGFDEKYLELYFSGGRGYHCHVKDPSIFDLDSNERREIVDYITARDLIDSAILREHVLKRTQFQGRSVPVVKSLRMPSPHETGWRGRISRGIIELLKDIKTSKNPLERLHEYGVKPNDAENLYRHLSDERFDRIKDGVLDQSKTLRKFFLNRALRKSAVTLSAGETDEPVTCDIKRLIRLPSSLHGKTGLKVVQIDIDKLEEFDPLRDAVVFSDKKISVKIEKSIKITLKDNDFDLSSGKATVPEYLAVFLIGKQLATKV